MKSQLHVYAVIFSIDLISVHRK